MTLGTGLFLSVFIASLLTLYLKTQDRWNWKRFRKIFLWILIVIIFLTVAAIFIGWLGEIIRNHPTRQNAYYDIKLGSNKDEVEYILGKPNQVFVPMQGALNKDWLVATNISELDGSKNFKNYSSWSYEGKNVINGKKYTLFVDFQKDKDMVSQISCYSEEWGCKNILGLGTFSSEEEVIDRLGKPSDSEFQNGSKITQYNSLNLRFLYLKQRVVSIAVKDFSYKN